MPDNQDLPLTPAQLTKIHNDGSAQNYAAMYSYIAGLMSGGQLTGATPDQVYWFQNAASVNANDDVSPAGFFVRDMTRIGMGLSSISDPAIQAVSNAIGLNVYTQIITSGAIPTFSTQLTDDISAAINVAGLTIGAWGGSFYFWNYLYTPPGQSTPTTVEDAILSSPTEENLFVTNTAQAIADTYNNFGLAELKSDPSVAAAIKKGFHNLGASDIPSALAGLEILEQVSLDIGQSATKQILQLIGSDSTGDEILASVGNTALTAGAGSDVLFGGQGVGGVGNDTLTGGSGMDSFVFVLPSTGSAVETIIDGTGNGQIDVVESSGQIVDLGGSASQPLAAVVGSSDTWQDLDGTKYEFNPSNGQMTVTNGYLGAGNSIVIDNFNLAAGIIANPSGASQQGYLATYLADTLSVTAGATAGIDPPASFPAGSTQSFTISVAAPSTAAQTVTLTLSGAIPSDFDAIVGNTVEQLNANGSFTVTLAAGQANVTFGLVDATTDNGNGDISSGATLTLMAVMPNAADPSGPALQASPISFNYVPGTPDTTQAPNPGDIISGQYNSGTGITTYTGDGAADYIDATGASNEVDAQDSGNDSLIGGSGTNTINGSASNDVVALGGTQDLVNLGSGFNTLTGGAGHDTIYGSFYGGEDIVSGDNSTDLLMLEDGNNAIYAGSPTSLANAIAAGSTGTGTGAQGDLISVLDGNNTIVGGSGNDLITAGAGHDIVIMGPGNDTFDGGEEETNALANWNTTVTTPSPGNESYSLELNNVGGYSEGFTNSYAQPYNGTTLSGGTSGPANDTILAGKGNDYIDLGNGNNYVEAGAGNDTILGGMGNDTIIAGAGTDYIRGGGGTTYIAGGSGTETLIGGDGNNTIIGGSGNATIQSAGGPTATWVNESLEQNYVDGGSGNDVIVGSGGQDTLVAGSGNATIFGGSGIEDIAGGPGNDLLVSGTGNDTVAANGSGRDTLAAAGSASSTSVFYGGDGQDVIDGGSGSETLYAGDGGVAAHATSVLASLSDPTALTTIYGGAGVDYLQGGAGATVLYAGDGGSAQAPTTLVGTSGDDTIYGGLGTDFIQGGSGTNVLYAGDGGTASAPTTVLGTTGVSTLYGGAAPAVLDDLESGSDLIISETADDTLLGIGSDTLVAGTGADQFQTTGGAVTVDVNAGFGNESVYGNGAPTNLAFGGALAPTDLSGSMAFDVNGNSYLVLSGDGGSISIESGLTGGVGSVSFAGSGSIAMTTLLLDAFGGDQTIAASANGNFMISLNSEDSVRAGSDEDTIASWGNNSTLAGGSTFNSDVIYSAGSSSVIDSGVGYDSLTATGSGDSVNAGNFGDAITVTGAGDSVNAGLGNDIITAEGANDTLVAGVGSGNSTFVVEDATTVVQVSSLGGVDTLRASVSYTAPTNVNVLTLTGIANISGTGNASSDTLTGGAGNDTLIAGTGLATMIGGSGNTTFVVNGVSDVVQDSSSTTSNTVQTSVNYALPAHVNTLVLTGTGALTGTANTGSDTLVSNSGADTLIGGSGNDTFVLSSSGDVIQDSSASASNTVQTSVSYTLPTDVNTLVLTGSGALTGTANSANDTLVSNSGLDTLVGSSGNDTFVINNTGDVVQDTSTSASNAIQSSVSYTLPADVNALTLTGTAALAATGNAASDVLTANTGNDTLIAGVGIATLVGGTGNDTFVVDSSADVVKDSSTSASNAIQSSVSYTLPTDVNSLTLTGTANLVATANSGNDTLISNSGVDTLVGGSGNDTFVINNAADVVTDTSTIASNLIESSVSYTLPSNVGALLLTGSGNLIGTANSENDSLVGNAGFDTLIAGSGNDTLVAGSGATTLDGGTGSAAFVVNSGADVVNATGSHGADTLESSVSYTLPSNVSTLVLTGSSNLAGTAISGSNFLTGNAGNDTLTAGPGNDTLAAGGGIDTLVGGSGADTFIVNNSADVLQNISSAAGNTLMSSISNTIPTNIGVLELSGSANLVATGGSAADTLIGNEGNDTLVAGSGIADLIGGLGPDVFVVNSAADAISEPNFGDKASQDTVESSVSYMLPSDETVLLLTGSANLAGTGNAHADSIVGNAGQDTLTAGTGNDTLVAGTGLATLIGSIGNTTFVIDSAGDVLQDSIGGQNNALISSVSATLPTNINTLTLTGSANLAGSANAANDSITGNAGNDTLTAGAGNDTLVAGIGPDTMVGGSGSDTFVVNSASDSIQNAPSGGNNAVFSSSNFVLPTNVNVLTLTGIANISGTGNASSDTLTGGAGNDTLIAGTGLATMIGGSGNTTFVVNGVSDVVQDSSSTTSNTVQTSVNYALPAHVNTLVLTGTGALTGTANTGSDTLVSNSGADTLIGGSGNDTFVLSSSGDVIQDSSASASNTVQTSVSYTLPTDVNTLVLTGSGALTGTANSANDTLVSNSGLDTLVGSSGNDTFVINNTGDVVQDTSTSASNAIQSSVSYTLPADVNALTLTGTAALAATGNAASDVLTANTGNDTLIAGVGIATLVGGTGNDTFVVDSSADVVKDSSTSASNAIQSSVSYTLPTDVNSLTLTGTANLVATANSGNDTLISNSGVDTLVGGSGNDTFVINNAADVVTDTSTIASNLIESSVSYTLPNDVQTLILTGTASLSATGNGFGDTLVGNTGNDTFFVNSAGVTVEDADSASSNAVMASVSYTLPANVDSLTLSGTAALIATGNTDASNVITANSGSDQLIGTAYNNTLYGGTGPDFIEAGPGSNVIYVNAAGTGSQVVRGDAIGTSVLTQNTIYGGGGADYLVGGPGTDLIYGGTGTTTIIAGSGFDSLYGTANSQIRDSVGGSDLLVAGAGAETLTGIDADTLVSGSGVDLLNDYSTTGAAEVFDINPGFGQDTIGNNGSAGDSLVFGAGIAPGNFAATAAKVASTGNDQIDIGLVLADGSSSITIPEAFVPGTISSVDFAGTGVESFTQFMDASGLGTASVPYNSDQVIVNTANATTLPGGTNIFLMFDFGNNNVVGSTNANDDGTVYEYGSNDTVYSSMGAGIAGSNDALDTVEGDPNLPYDATISGANDTIVAGFGSQKFLVKQSSTVIEASSVPGYNGDSVDAVVNYTLPVNVPTLSLDSSMGGLAASSNAQGGTLTAKANFDTLTGSSGSDTLSAQASNDVLIGGAGKEAFYLLNATDTIELGAGTPSLNTVYAEFSYTLPDSANTLYVQSSSATGTGNGASDRLFAAGSADTLVAGSGNDTMSDSFVATTMIGGAGNDTFEVNVAGDVVQDSSSTSNNTALVTVSYTLPTNVNALILSANASAIAGTANSANDSLTANANNDTLVAGSGNDSLLGYGSGETFEFNSGFGDDQILSPQGGDVIQFGTGIMESSLTFSALPGSGGTPGSLVISGDGGSVTVQGGLVPGAINGVSFSGGNSFTVPQLVAPSGRTTVTGSNGNLILSPNNADSVTAGSGQDTVIAWGNSDTLNAGSGGTLIYAGGTGDAVNGGSATDTLDAIGSNNTLTGGSGNETFVVNDPTTVIQVSAGVGHDTILSSVSYSMPANVSILTLTGSANINATANANDDLITANSGDDQLASGSGIDTLIGGGNDLFIVSTSGDVVEETHATANDTLESAVTYSLPANINTLILTGTADLIGTGNAQNDSLTGNDGNDTLIAGSGNDTLLAGTGIDVLQGGAGQDVLGAGTGDTLISGTGIDTLGGSEADVFVINNSADVLDASFSAIYSSVSYTLTGSGNQGDTLYLTGSVNLVADDKTGQNSNLNGNAGNDTLIAGGAENSFTDGTSTYGTGSGTFIGAGPGSTNSFEVDNPADVIEAQSGAANALYMGGTAISYTLPEYVDTAYVGTGDTATGNADSDFLQAGGASTLIAGAGNDTLVSFGGTNTLIVGAGNDSLSLESSDTAVLNAGFGNSQIFVNFGTGAPTIQFGSGISGSGLTASAGLDVNGNAALVISEGGQAVTLDGALAGQAYQFKLGGGSVLTLAQFLAQVNVTTSSVAGASGNVILEGTPSTGLTGGTGNDTIYAVATSDTITGGSGNQVLNALAANDSVVGGSASDTLMGLGTNDTLAAGTAVDTLIGGTGASVEFVVNNTGDVIQLQSSPGVDTVASSATYSLPAGISALQLTGTAAVKGTANSGNDTLTSNTGIDTLVGGSGNDFFIVNNSGDAVQDTSSSASNTIEAAFSFSLPTDVNTLILTGTSALKGTANAGTDTLTSNTGADTLVGSTGNDTFILNSTADVVTDTSTTAINTIQAPFSYTLPTDVNSLVLLGSANLTGVANGSNDTLTSNTGVDTLVGGAGSDVFVVNNAADVIQDTSGSAMNSIQSSVSYTLPTNVNALFLTGTANITGTANAGNDTLTSNSGVDTLVGGAGNDTFVLSNPADTVLDTSTTASNTISSSVSYSLPTNTNALIFSGTAALTGTANSGNDTLTANSGADTLAGGAGNDTFFVKSTADVVTDTSASASNTISSTVSFSLPTDVNVLVFTGTAALKGTANSGADSLTANTGADTLTGGAGNDTFFVDSTANVVTDTSTTTSNSISSTVSYALPTNVNTLTFTGTAALKGTANSGNDSLTANTGADTLAAGSGADTLVSGASGADSLVGGAGNDTFFVNNTADKVTDTSTTATNVIESSVTYTLPADVNIIILTGTAAIAGTGNAHTDSITGNGGADTLTAGSAVATLIGGTGNDTFVLNNTGDVVTDTSTTASNTLSSSVTYSLPTNVNTLAFTGTAALKGTANNGADSLTANTGADTLVGGAGNDTFFVKSTADVVTDTSTSASNTISSTIAYSLPANVNALIFTGTAALKGTANAGTDTLTANTGADTLAGGAGNDTFFVDSTANVVTDTSTTASNTISSTVTYSLPTNVNNLILTGTASLKGTANAGTDTLTSNMGVDTLVGGAGNDTFFVNNTAVKVTDTSATATNVLESSVMYTLPTDVNTLILTGAAAIAGTGNAHTDSMTANSGADTLTAGSAVATLIGGAGNDTFVLNNTGDVVTDTSTSASNAISSSVAYSLPTNVNTLVFTGTAALKGTANSGADSLTANTGADTLIAGSGTDTLVSGASGADSLVGGTGNDTFVVNNTADVVFDTSTTAANALESSVNYVLPANVEYLMLTGTAALTASGNSVANLITGNGGNDTLTAGTGIAILEGGRTAGQDQISDSGSQGALIAGGGSSTLTGGAHKDFFAAGAVSDSITTGATANVVSVNQGDGATTLQPTTSATNVLSLGAGIDTESLYFSKSGNNLILTDGVTGDSITFNSWYSGSNDQNYTTLQVVEIASGSYNPNGSDPLHNEALEEFNFTSIVSAYNSAGSPSNWALSNAMPSAQLTSSSTADYGGDLAYYYGLNGNVTGMDLSAAQSTLTNSAYATGTQTIDSWSSISGGGGLHLLLAPHPAGSPAMAGISASGVASATTEVAAPAAAAIATAHASAGPALRLPSASPATSGALPEAPLALARASLGALSLPLDAKQAAASASSDPSARALETGGAPRGSLLDGLDPFASSGGIVTPAAIDPLLARTAISGGSVRPGLETLASPSWNEVAKRTSAPPEPTVAAAAGGSGLRGGSYVDPIQIAWADLHLRMAQSTPLEGASEALRSDYEIAASSLLASAEPGGGALAHATGNPALTGRRLGIARAA